VLSAHPAHNSWPFHGWASRRARAPQERYLSTGAGLELSNQPLTAAEQKFREGQLAGQRPVARGVKCHGHVTWRVMGMQWALGCFNKKGTFCSDCEQKTAIRTG